MRIVKPSNPPSHRAGAIVPFTLVAASLLLGATAPAADIAEADRLYKAGKYAECIELAGKTIDEGGASEMWLVLRMESQLALGRYAEAGESLEAALELYPSSIWLRWIGGDVYRYNGKPESAENALAEIAELADRSSSRYRDAISLVVLGRFFLAQGADAKQVLTAIYNKVKKEQPRMPHAFVASGDLALQKHDYGLAAAAFEQAARLDPLDPEIQYGLARAYEASDSEKATAALQAALRLNPRHVPSLLYIVDEHIDAERYAEAEKTIQEIFAVNPKQPLAWAFRAVLAHLDNDAERERAARETALSTWRENPEVDFLIGKKLSQKYRFAEGAAYQRRALAFDSAYLPAKSQLAQDLLRLGEEPEGWKLAGEVFEQDNYNVVAHNLSTLRGHLEQFAILERDGFVVRMDAREAKIYGRRVLDLLAEARRVLCEKYDARLEEPIYVDIYPRQQDFAIRTFGLPGGAGFLGVCFGRVITMNSPASQGASPSNWQAVLWHEFCHVATLNKTNNKMPRWLSEGISVYEERQANPAWGQSMNLQYREMVLEGELTPVSRLSGAFLQPESPLHLQFAYYESSLVVEFLIEKYGLETLRRILVDLGVGMPINDSLGRYAGSIAALDEEFADFARGRAESLAPQADFTEPDWESSPSPDEVAAWVKEHPGSFYGLTIQARQLIAAEKWEQAKAPLEKLLEIYPDHYGGDSALVMSAVVHRQLGESEQEKHALGRLAELDADAVDVYLRLAEMASAAEDWEAVITRAEQTLAVNPLLKAPHRFLAEAAEKAGDDPKAIAGLLALIEMEPFDPADLHYRAARRFQSTGDAEQARLHVLQSLEEAPRYRDAHRLLLEIVEENSLEEDSPTKTP